MSKSDKNSVSNKTVMIVMVKENLKEKENIVEI